MCVVGNYWTCPVCDTAPVTTVAAKVKSSLFPRQLLYISSLMVGDGNVSEVKYYIDGSWEANRRPARAEEVTHMRAWYVGPELSS